jgi:hypothetical protein
MMDACRRDMDGSGIGQSASDDRPISVGPSGETVIDRTGSPDSIVVIGRNLRSKDPRSIPDGTFNLSRFITRRGGATLSCHHD